MSKKKSSSCIGLVLFIVLIGIGLAIVWVLIPILAEKPYGAPTSALTSLQLRQYGFRLWLAKNNFENPKPASITNIPFEIEEGSSISKISADLEKTGLVRNGDRFRDYLIYKGFDSSIKAGTFLIPNTSSPIEIAEILRSDNPIASFYLYPGWRSEEVANGLIASGVLITSDEFLRIVNKPTLITLPVGLEGISSLEGFLFPGVYEIPKDTPVAEVTQLLLDRFASEAMPSITAYSSSTGLTTSEIVTMASIIQRESLETNENTKIASVFYNRLDIGMKLETDPTVQYSIGYDQNSASWWKTPLEIADLRIQNDFNTYVNYGLPPHPIANPGIAAILAVLHPESTPYYFFQAKCDLSGTHVFSETFEEHLSHNCQ